MQQVKEVTSLCPEEATPYVGEALTRLREEVKNESTVLGFVGAPFTLACYIVEGESSKMYTHMKTLMFSQPAVLHALLDKLADSIADYVRYQVSDPNINPCVSSLFTDKNASNNHWCGRDSSLPALVYPIDALKLHHKDCKMHKLEIHGKVANADIQNKIFTY